jgi:hypothetical protein
MDQQQRAVKVTESRRARWSLTAFVMLAALIFSILGFRKVTSAVIFIGLVVVIVMVGHAARRLAGRRNAS